MAPRPAPFHHHPRFHAPQARAPVTELRPRPLVPHCPWKGGESPRHPEIASARATTTTHLTAAEASLRILAQADRHDAATVAKAAAETPLNVYRTAVKRRLWHQLSSTDRAALVTAL